MDLLKKALCRFSDDTDLIGSLARVLAYLSEKGRVSYHEVLKMVGDNAEDVLLLGNEWRLVLPVRTRKTAAWEDRLLLSAPVELYEVPNIVRYLVANARETGQWDPDHALTELFREMGDPGWSIIPRLVEGLRKQSEDNRITAIQIKEVCRELGLEDRVGALIAELKGSGVTSPKLGSPAEVHRARSVIFELNPSLFVPREKKR
jgi:hypothetical protein